MRSALPLCDEDRSPVLPEAIRHALAPYLDADGIEKALQIWARRYADKPTFALPHFVSECSLQFSLSAARPEILQRIIRYLALPENRRRMSAKQGGEDFSSADARAVPVFQLLFESLCRDAGARQGESIRRYVKDHLVRLPIALAARRSVEAWLNGLAPQLACALSLVEMRLLVNIAYVGLCECCGPVKADAILHAAVRQASASASGKDFPAEGFL